MVRLEGEGRPEESSLRGRNVPRGAAGLAVSTERPRREAAWRRAVPPRVCARGPPPGGNCGPARPSAARLPGAERVPCAAPEPLLCTPSPWCARSPSRSPVLCGSPQPFQGPHTTAPRFDSISLGPPAALFQQRLANPAPLLQAETGRRNKCIETHPGHIYCLLCNHFMPPDTLTRAGMHCQQSRSAPQLTSSPLETRGFMLIPSLPWGPCSDQVLQPAGSHPIGERGSR